MSGKQILPRTLRNFCIPEMNPNTGMRRSMRRYLTSLDFEVLSVCTSIGEDVLESFVSFKKDISLVQGQIINLAKDVSLEVEDINIFKKEHDQVIIDRLVSRFTDVDQSYSLKNKYYLEPKKIKILDDHTQNCTKNNTKKTLNSAYRTQYLHQIVKTKISFIPHNLPTVKNLKQLEKPSSLTNIN